MFSTLRRLFCCKEPKTPLGFCDGPSRKTGTLFCSKCRTIVYRQQYKGKNKFHSAVCSGRLKVALRLLAKEGFHVNDKDERNRTALHFACFHGHLHLVNFLLFNDCEIDVLDDENSTPLMKAVQSLETVIVSVLLDNGADPNIKNCNGQTAIHLAVYGDSVEIASNLLEFGGNIEETTEDGLTPLMLALQERKLLIAEYLITKGANIHVRDGHQRTTLMYGVKWDCPGIDLLLKRGVDYTLRDEFRWSALMYASVGKRKIRRLIFKHVNSLFSRRHNSFIGTSDMYTMFMSGSCDSEKMLLYSVEMETQMEPHRFWELNQGNQPKDIFSTGHHFNSESPISVCSRTEDRVNFETEERVNFQTQQDIPGNILQNGTDDFQTMASKQYENTEAQEVWAEKCLHPELRDYSHQISKPETEPQQSQPVWAYKCLHPELRDSVHQISIPKTEPQQLEGDTTFLEEIDEEIQEYKMEKEESLDRIEENPEFDASTDTPQSSNMEIDEEKNVLRHLEKKSVMEDQKQTSEEEQIQDSGRKHERTFIDAIRACFCSCFTKKSSSSPHHKK